MTVSTIARPELAGSGRTAPTIPAWGAGVSLGFFGFLVSFIGIGNPSLWGDEAASILSAERPLPSLFRMLGNVDAVHGTYYLFLHFWIRVFRTSELSVRKLAWVGYGVGLAIGLCAFLFLVLLIPVHGLYLVLRRRVSRYVAAHAGPGAAIVFGDTVRNSRPPRLAMRMYSQDYRGLSDIELVTPWYETAGLWDVTAPLDAVTGQLATTNRVVLLTERGSRDSTEGADLNTLERLGFQQQNDKTVNRTTVHILTRGTP
jgi:hypothetical protein